MFNLFKKKTKNNIVTRIAPSPTGVLHIGTARAALFNYLYAKQNGGKFVLRIEDTDKERSTKEFEQNIVDSLKWLGFEWDDFYRQSERTEIYKKYIDKLISEDKAYVSKEEGGERDSVIRFRNPNKEIIFDDEIRGEIKFDTTELGDFVIAKSTDEPIYHLAVVIDDHEMGITHIIRGEDGISNTPRQMLIQDAIGAKTPLYAHLPLVLGKDKSKLSKRHGATSLDEFKSQGYLKDAIINQLAFLGWNPGDEREIFSLKELIAEFDLKKVSKGGAVFNEEKLDWFNKEWISKMPDSEFEEILEKELEKFSPSKEFISKIILVIKERISKLDEIKKMISEGELDFYFETPDCDVAKINFKDTPNEKTIELLNSVKDLISNVSQKDSVEDIKSKVWDFATKEGRGQVLSPLRYSLSGRDRSPDPFTLISILGKEESFKRIDLSIEKLNGK